MATTSSPTLATSTVTNFYTQTYCSIGTAESFIQGPTEVNIYTSTYTDPPVVSVEYYASSYVTEAPGRCELFQVGDAHVEPNPDISGISVIAPRPMLLSPRAQ